MSDSAGFGGIWKYTLYFDPRADQPVEEGYLITDEELRVKFIQLLDASEEILKVRIYTNPLYKWQFTQFILYHAFIVFETQNWWWSIEKNAQGLTIQRSKTLNSIKQYYRRIERTSGIRSVELFKEATGKGTVSDLVHYLWRKDELNKSYLFIYRNCQDFVNVVFNGTNAEGKKDALTPLCCQPVDSSIDIVYFDPRADLASSIFKVTNYLITPEQLIATLSQETELIQQIDVYSCPLKSYQLRKKVMYHAFIVIETNLGHFWSFEKNRQNITVQGAENKNTLVKTYRRRKRPSNIFTPITQLRTSKAVGTLRDLVDFIWKRDNLNQPYDISEGNSKDFAKAIYMKFKTEGEDL